MVDLNILSDGEILSLTIIGEARGERIEGQVAVGSVIRNRCINQNKSYKQICLSPRQFSCWNENDPNRVILLEIAERMIAGQKINDPYLNQCIYVAFGIMSNDILDNTNGAVNYLTKDLFETNTVAWAKNATNLTAKGNHIFFNV